jgi:hypothetical protein
MEAALGLLLTVAAAAPPSTAAEGVTSAEPTEAAEAAAESLFRTSIPAGFENLSAPQTSLIDVYFLGQQADVAMGPSRRARSRLPIRRPWSRGCRRSPSPGW